MQRQHTVECAGHPWDGPVRPFFDHLYVHADTPAEMDDLVKKAKLSHWQPWLIGREEKSGLPAGLMYKPSGTVGHWEDSVDTPHPGGMGNIDRVAYQNIEETLPTDPIDIRHRAQVDSVWLHLMVDPHQRIHAAMVMYEKTQNCPLYAHALKTHRPITFNEVIAAGIEDQKRSTAKDDRKAKDVPLLA